MRDNTSENVISVENLTKTFKVVVGNRKGRGVITAVNDVSFDIKNGEFLGLIGNNGAGKTTILKMLSGIMFPSDGTVSVLGYTPWDRCPEFQKRIAFVMGNKNQLWWDLPARDTFELNAAVYEISNEDYGKRLDELIELFDLVDVIDRPVRGLSLGQRMKCEIAAGLLHRPEVIFLDEPTIGLDVVMQRKIRSFLKEYNERSGATIILTSHYMEDVSELCERVMVIDKGEFIYDGALDTLVKNHVNWKYISVFLKQDSKVSSSVVSRYGEVVRMEDTSFVVKVKKGSVSDTAARILKELDVEDLDINGVRLEEVIADMYKE